MIAEGVIHTTIKFGYKLVTLLSDKWLLLPSVICRVHTYRSQIWVQAGHTGVSGVIWVIYTGPSASYVTRLVT